MGMELELSVAGADSSRSSVAEEVLGLSEDEDLFCLKEDGSIDSGFEIVTHPMTFEAWKAWEGGFDKVLKTASGRGCKGHNAGGIHIHTSLDAWEPRQLFLLYSLIFNKRNRKFLLFITQRREHNMNRWASLSAVDVGSAKTRIEAKSGYDVAYTKYSALNMTDTTLEFRIFNSNLRIERVMKNIEFTYALYLYTKEFAAKGKRVGVASLAAFIRKNETLFPNLCAFIESVRLDHGSISGMFDSSSDSDALSA
jgi:hypothetical protein